MNPDNSCKTTCPSHYFKDNSNNKCVKCHSTCLECNGSSSDNCIICDTSNYLNPDGTCKSNCPEKFFKKDYTITNKCEPCHITCKYCTNFTEDSCIECYDGKYLTSTN